MRSSACLLHSQLFLVLIILAESVSLSALTGPAGPRQERKDQMGKLTQTPEWGTLQAFKPQKRARIVPSVAMTPVSVARCVCATVCVCVCVFIRGSVVAMETLEVLVYDT